MNFDNYTPKELHKLVYKMRRLFGYARARRLQQDINRWASTDEKKTLEPHPNPVALVEGGAGDTRWRRY